MSGGNTPAGGRAHTKDDSARSIRKPEPVSVG